MPTTLYVWDVENDSLIEELDGSGNSIATYTQTPNQFGGTISEDRGGSTSYYHYDGLGSTLALSNQSGVVTDEYSYSAYGEVVASSGSSINPFKYVGKYGYYTDSETNDIYIRARTYQPTVARWCSRDPIGFSGGTSLLYELPWCLMVVDPMGLGYHFGGPKTLALSEFKDGAGANTWLDEDTWIDNDLLNIYKQPGCPDCHCAIVVKGKDRHTVAKMNLPPRQSEKYSLSGFLEIRAHEYRREEVYRRSYSTYMDPVRNSGPYVTRCGLVCSKTPGKSVTDLLDYLKKIRKEASLQYSAYNQAGQRIISLENLDGNRLDINGIPIEDPNSDGVFHKFKVIQSVPNTPPLLVRTPCPTSDCFPNNVYYQGQQSFNEKEL